MAKNKDQITVYPAYAGVILEVKSPITKTESLSRIRGGDPAQIVANFLIKLFIPHTRG